jgi:hypothetical protein
VDNNSPASDMEADSKELALGAIDFDGLDNKVLKAALSRIKDRETATHADYYTQHNSHSRYSKGW